ncbi:indole-3-glycerol phosphate synthase TrpC [Dialister sp.]|uniref:indole-3-glycerol phosphate synthase TrpC n=1 Tax=Dialister sp. TaxID=1955814 RepID=UPI003F07D116
MILDDIAAEARKRTARLKAEGYYDAIHEKAAHFTPSDKHLFYRNLSAPGLSFICELKKASPSKGLISPDFPFEAIAREYEEAGASAISCLTEPKWFKGDIAYLKRVAGEVHIPVLRKDFIIDACQIEEAALAGASAILLIAAILKDEEIRSFMKQAEELGLDVLAEAHDEEEMERMLKAGARIVGVNNRDLRDFTIKMENTERLARLVPEDVLLVSESGMTDRNAVHQMRQAGADAVLIGEMLMRAENRTELLRQMIQENS